MTELQYTRTGSLSLFCLTLVLTVPLIVWAGMPVWGAVAVVLVIQTGWWSAYLIIRGRERRG